MQARDQWVQAHQDSDRAFTDLPHNAQLNVLADQMAGNYLATIKSKALKPRAQPMLFTSMAISLIVNGQRITGKYKDVMRFHIHGTRLRSFLQGSQKEWHNDTVWHSIDMESLGHAYKQLGTTKRHQASKMIYGWQNTGHQRAKITPNADTSCTLCRQTNETQEHILQCKDG